MNIEICKKVICFLLYIVQYVVLAVTASLKRIMGSVTKELFSENSCQLNVGAGKVGRLVKVVCKWILFGLNFVN